MQLAFVRWGEPDVGTKLLFLHGMGGTGALWRPIAASLEKDFDILAPDQRGHGQSLIPEPDGMRQKPKYHPVDYGRDVIETMEKEDFQPSWLIGHSMGVRTACAVAHLKSEVLQGLVLIDLGVGKTTAGLGTVLADFLKDLPIEFATRREARRFLKENCPDHSIAQYLIAVSERTPEGGLRFPFDKRALIETVYAVRDSSLHEWVHEIAEKSIPTLILRGEQSGVWTEREYEEERKLYGKYSSIHFETFPGAGHGLPFEKRKEFVERLKSFVENPF